MYVPACLPSSRRAQHWRGLAALVGLVFLSGCATLPPGQDLPSIDDWETRQQVLGSLRDWSFKGRIAVKAGDDGFNGKIRWTQQDSRFSATVSGPLGVGTVRIEGAGGAVVLTDKDGTRIELQDAEADLKYRFGWTIPVDSLRYWALGIPDPSAPAETRFDDQGQLVELKQSRWTVNISRYREGGGQPMPAILTATNPDTRVRMVIDSWLFPER
ncbi:MAG: lipoprotein insertase outer membrane protein LolB [Gammaproteobacteria bacterium]|nr:lipoprotein insertase outer membrane protein LolB [Gammaproteobacteria bacterium]